jgi:hypothetical protein
MAKKKNRQLIKKLNRLLALDPAAINNLLTFRAGTIITPKQQVNNDLSFIDNDRRIPLWKLLWELDIFVDNIENPTEFYGKAELERKLL